MLSEQEIIHNAATYKKKGIKPLNLDPKDEMYLWFSSVWSHMEKALLPQLKERGENLIEFYPTCFLFAETTAHQQDTADPQPSVHRSGTHASGCICFSSKNIYFVALQAVTSEIPSIQEQPDRAEPGRSRNFFRKDKRKGSLSGRSDLGGRLSFYSGCTDHETRS